MTDDTHESKLSAFEAHRSRLFGLAYRMLGSAADADDIVQDAWLRWSSADAAEVRSPGAWLTATTTRLAIDRLRSARVQREQYIGPWLPEPLVTDNSADNTASLADDLSIALLLLLERLTPAERAVFILREAFDLPFDEIATIIEKSENNCRQLLRRARQHVPDESRTKPVAPVVGQQVIERFVAAMVGRDHNALVALLRDDVVLQSDGGGKAPAAGRPLLGVAEVAKFLLGLAKLAEKQQLQAEVRPHVINQRPGLLLIVNGELSSVFAFDLDDQQRIQTLHVVRNPDKLARLR